MRPSERLTCSLSMPGTGTLLPSPGARTALASPRRGAGCRASRPGIAPVDDRQSQEAVRDGDRARLQHRRGVRAGSSLGSRPGRGAAFAWRHRHPAGSEPPLLATVVDDRDGTIRTGCSRRAPRRAHRRAGRGSASVPIARVRRPSRDPRTLAILGCAAAPRCTRHEPCTGGLAHSAARLVGWSGGSTGGFRSLRRNGATVKRSRSKRAHLGKGTVSSTSKGDGKTPVRLLSGGNPQIPKGTGDGPVQAYIAAMPGWKSAVGRRLDALIATYFPKVQKAVRWNSPFYGIEGQGWLVSFHVLAKYVQLNFFSGASLEPVPPGSGKDPNARWINIHEGDTMDEDRIADWLQQAARLPGWSSSGS